MKENAYDAVMCSFTGISIKNVRRFSAPKFQKHENSSKGKQLKHDLIISHDFLNASLSIQNVCV